MSNDKPAVPAIKTGTMKIAVLLLAVLSLTAAKPGGYHHQQYSFEQSSASYKNNELQHKNEEQGRYTKFQDLDSPDKPQESSVYHQSEYNAPGADKEHAPRGIKGHRQQTWQSNLNQRNLFKDSESEHKVVFTEESDKSNAGSSYSVTENPDEGTTEAAEDTDGSTIEPISIDSRWGHGGHSHHGGHTWEYHHGGQRQGSHHRQGGFHHRGQQRGGHHGSGSRWHTPGHSHPGGRGYHQHPHTGHGSGRDYWENTEGGRTSLPGTVTPVVPTGTGTVPTVRPVVPTGTDTVPAVRPVVPIGTGTVPTVRPVVPTGTGTGDLQNVFGQIDAIAAETGDQENLGRGMLDIRSGGIGRPKLFMRMHDDVTQHQEDLTQQTQDLTQQTQDLTQQTEDLTQQHQDGFGTLEVASQYQSNQKHDHLEDLTQQQSQTGFGKLERGQEQTRTLPMTADRGQHQLDQTSDLTQQHQDGFGTLEVGSQYQQHQQRSDKLEDLTQQTQDGFSGFEFGGQQHEDLTQQTQDLIQQSQDLTQQTQDLTQQTQDLTQQTQDFRQQTQDLTQQHEDLTQQTQDGFGTLEFGQQQEGQTRAQHMSQNNQATGRGRHTSEQGANPNYKLFNEEQYLKFVAHADDLTQQQSHSGFDKIEVEDVMHQSHASRPSGKLEQATQQHDDLTQHGFGNLTQQQSQDGTFEFGSQYQQQSNQNQDKLDLMQQHADLTQQQTQDKLGKLEFGVQHHGDLTQQHEDLTQQHQDGFNLTQQHADLTQQHEDLTQQTQDGFGTFEIGSQYQQQSQQRSEDLTQQRADLTQQHEDLTQQTQDGFGQLELGQQHVPNGDWRTRHYQQHSERSQSQSSTYSSRYHHTGQLNYAQVSHTGAEETTGELVHGALDHQHAQQVEDVSQHVQRVDDIKFEDQNEKLEDFNQRSTQEILAKKHDDATLQGRDVHHEDAETEKPGFWKRVGSSITSTYESAKEKSKTLAEKVKANLG
ncbi:hypothetical protein CBL_07827 [Carabus blaptoides fortunei]